MKSHCVVLGTSSILYELILVAKYSPDSLMDLEFIVRGKLGHKSGQNRILKNGRRYFSRPECFRGRDCRRLLLDLNE